MIRLALRNLLRNRWRSGLMVGGMAIAVATLAWTQGLLEAIVRTIVDGTTSVQTGDLSIETKAHADEGTLHDTIFLNEERLKRVSTIPGIRSVAPRLETFGLLGNKAGSQNVMFIGVDPKAEAVTSRVPNAVVKGTWLSQGNHTGFVDRPVVLGEGLAKRLGAREGDELVALLQTADGSLGDDRLRVMGIVRTDTSVLDHQAAWVRLDDLAWLTALEGQAHRLMVRVVRSANLEQTVTAVREVLIDRKRPELSVRSWKTLAPDLYQFIQLMEATMGLLNGFIFLVAALGVFNVQRMGTLERRRELAVMMAMGTTPTRIVGLLMLEMVLLSAIGVAMGALLGWAIMGWQVHTGLNLAALGSDSHTNMGIRFSSRMAFELHPSMILGPSLMLLLLSALSGLWPALRSARLELVRAISGRT